MRVSERQRYDVATSRIERAKDENIRQLEQLSSQKRINNLHDDPIGCTSVIKEKDRIKDIESFQSNVDFSKGFLDITESVISQIQERLGRARDLTIAMANDSYGASSRQSTSREIKEIINEVIQLGNSKYNSRYIFSGFRTQSPALDRDGVYLGDDGAIFLQIEQNNFKKINISGRNFFEATPDERTHGHYNMVDALSILQEGLETSDKDILYRSIDELDFHMDKASNFQANVGAIYNAVNQAEKQLEVAKEKETVSLSAVEDADMYKSTSDFKRTEAVLQSTLLSSTKLLQPSLLNFMQ